MFSTLLWTSMRMFQEQAPEVGWDLVTMWHNMGYPGQGRGRNSLHHVRVVGGHHD